LVASVADAYRAGETIGSGRKHVVLVDCGVKKTSFATSPRSTRG